MTTPVSSGVPQGSVLGPLLFIIYLENLIATINHQCLKTTVYAYADDIKLVSTDSQDLQQALDIVSTWTNDWGLFLNTNKSEHITLRCKQPISFSILNQVIPKVKNVRDLGLTLSEDLKWNSYVHKVRARANVVSHIILRTFTPSNTQLLVNLFKMYVRPIMEYNTSSWSPYYKSDIHTIESVQMTFTRYLCQRANIKFSNYKNRLDILNLESLESRRVKRDLLLLYKILNGLVDIDAADFFHASTNGGYNLRRHKLQITRQKISKTLCRQNFFSHRIVQHWNELPENIVTSPSLTIFKHKLNKLKFQS